MRARAVLLIMAALLSVGCRRGVQAHLQEPYPEKLSAWNLFRETGRAWEPNEGVLPYTINTPMFADYTEQRRTIWMPHGTAAQYKDSGSFEFPTGTIVTKTFFYSDTRLETQLLVRTPSGWVGLPYVWNEQQSEAYLRPAGELRPTVWRSIEGNRNISYRVANANQCKECHEHNKAMQPIALRADQLNRNHSYSEGMQSQLEHWKTAGLLSDAPPHEQAPRMAEWNSDRSGDLEARARAYLDANCAHCHQPGAAGNAAGLYLGADIKDPAQLGVCRPPAIPAGSGGLPFAVNYGKPDESVLLYRMNSTQPKVMMPELGRTMVHKEGVELIREWIAKMQGDCAVPAT
jgi:uncharacterized repeat protein (TIGR03806 family)